MRVVLAGQRWLGAEVFHALRALPGVQVATVCAPPGDRLERAALAAQVPTLGTVSAQALPACTDLLVVAHWHGFITAETLARARHGGIGYHPSLLPLHRGRDAVEWTVRHGDKVAGGTVYRLSDCMDGGPVLAQRHRFVLPGDDAAALWRRELAPLGVELLREVVAQFAATGYTEGVPQDERLATVEPRVRGYAHGAG